MESTHYIRTLRIPVAEIISGTKADFYRDLRESVDLSTKTANRVLSLCMADDQAAFIKADKVPKSPKLYMYPVVSKDFPGSTTLCATICRGMESKYIQNRFDIIRGKRSLPSERNTPWPLLSNKGHRTIRRDGDQWTIKLFGQWWTVRLRSGSNYARHQRTLASLEDSQIRDSSIWIDRRGVAVIGIAVALPKTQSPHAGTLHVSTARDALLVAVKDANDTPFTFNADHLKGWQVERSRRMQRLRQDRKAGATRRYIGEQMKQIGRKYHDRMKSLCRESAAHVVKHATRRRLNKVVFDGTIRSYCGDFPWFELKLSLQHACESSGIEFEDRTLAILEPDLSKPHVYFLYSPSTQQVKIGFTRQTKGKRKSVIDSQGGLETIVMAVDNHPAKQLKSAETRYHAMFAEHRTIGEWFRAEPVIAWMREAGCLGNAGNRSQIAQVIPLDGVPSDEPAPSALIASADEARPSPVLAGCRQTVGDIARVSTAPEVNDRLIVN